MPGISIDRSKGVGEEPGTGHNRWHPSIEPVLRVAPGQVVELETRDALDGQLTSASTEANFGTLNLGRAHALTGPVHLAGAEPGDLLEVEFVSIEPQPWAYTAITPGSGYLGEVGFEPLLVHWKIEPDQDGGWARSEQLPGLRLPGAPFMGVSGVAPSLEEVDVWSAREAAWASRGGRVFAPSAEGAVPTSGLAASEGLRTIPPRENGGNMDVKQLTAGSRLFLPVSVEGALFSTGDGHFAQGDGEVCLTAAEMGGTVVVRFAVHKGEAEKVRGGPLRFSHAGEFARPEQARLGNFIATMGMPIDADGVNEGENLNLATRNALLAMIDLLGERGYNRSQAYAICSVAVDLKISQVVDVPNFIVSAFLAEEMFETG